VPSLRHDSQRTHDTTDLVSVGCRGASSQVIGAFDRELDLSTYRDEYREGLQKIIDAKIN